MKKIISLIGASAVLIAGMAFQPITAEAANDETGSSFRQIPVYRKSMNENEKLRCLFFDDMPNVPYLSMEKYYSTFMQGEMTVSDNGRGGYSYTEKEYGQTAFANAVTDAMVINDPAYFIATPVFKKSWSELLFGGPEDMVTVSKTEIEKASAPLRIDLGRYGIDIREKDGVLYFPFATLCDIFNNVDCLTAVYSHGKIYFVSMYDEINGGNAKSDDLGNLGWITDEERPSDMVEFAYNELCFSTELFYGYPCDDNEFSNKMKSSGLDSALAELDPDTKELLLSQDPGEYLAGIGRLFMFDLCDGGHTGASIDNRLVDTISNLPVYSTYYKKFMGNLESLPYYYAKQMNIVSRHSQCRDTRKKLFGNVGYYSEGDTAYIIFDSFRVEYQGWRDYFSGVSSEMPVDSISVVYNGFLRAANEGIKNVIFDLSANTGGDTIALESVCGMICGDFTIRYTESLGGGTVRQTYSTDRNLDGVINSLDRNVSYDDFNIAVLTSRSSFSCGNMMSMIMKEMGYPIIGEQSSGGSCAVLMRTTADGFDYNMSGYLKITEKDGGDINKGIPVDISLNLSDDDVSALYDVRNVGALVAQYYENEKPAQQSEPSIEEESSEQASRTASSVSSEESADESESESTSESSAQSEIDVISETSGFEGSSTQLLSGSVSISSEQPAQQIVVQEGVSGTAVVVGIAIIIVIIIVLSVIAVTLGEKKRKGS